MKNIIPISVGALILSITGLIVVTEWNRDSNSSIISADPVLGNRLSPSERSAQDNKPLTAAHEQALADSLQNASNLDTEQSFDYPRDDDPNDDETRFDDIELNDSDLDDPEFSSAEQYADEELPPDDDQRIRLTHNEGFNLASRISTVDALITQTFGDEMDPDTKERILHNIAEIASLTLAEQLDLAEQVIDGSNEPGDIENEIFNNIDDLLQSELGLSLEELQEYKNSLDKN